MGMANRTVEQSLTEAERKALLMLKRDLEGK